MALAVEVVEKLTARNETLAAVESCTAGLAAGFIGAVPGASNVLWGSFVCYTLDAKEQMLEIPEKLLKEQGAVSESVALAMAGKALEKSRASWAFSITGLAGPGADNPGTAVKNDCLPIGTVWIGFAHRDSESAGGLEISARKYLFTGSRNDVREAAVAAALERLLEGIKYVSP